MFCPKLWLVVIARSTPWTSTRVWSDLSASWKQSQKIRWTWIETDEYIVTNMMPNMKNGLLRCFFLLTGDKVKTKTKSAPLLFHNFRPLWSSLRIRADKTLLQLTADESIFLSPFQRSERSLPGSAKVWLSLDLNNELIWAPIHINSSTMNDERVNKCAVGKH